MDQVLSPIPSSIRWTAFALVLTLALLAYFAYGANLVLWKDATDYGWRAMYDSGPHMVDEVFGRGWQAGLRVGDRILFINGRSYDTFDELFFTIRNKEPGAENIYTVLRDDRTVDIHITNGVLGLGAVLKRSGPLFIVGLFYVFMGVLVYLMKPYALESWVFLLMTTAMGTSISYASPSDLMNPLWLFKFRLFMDIFLPAPIIHLALIFPRRRRVMTPGRWLWPIPYVVSLLIFLFFRPFTVTYWNAPANMDLANNLYLLFAVLLFVGSTAFNLFKDPSHGIRIQSRMIMFGIVIGMVMPVMELLLRQFTGIFLFPDPALSFATLLSVFPLSVGYTIVRHDLFAIDETVRRTFGYALSTAGIVGIYALVVAVLNLSIPSTDISRSPIFTVLFAIAIVIAFRPLHERVQRTVDRTFFRGKPDYKKTIISISDSLSSVLNLDEIIIRIIHAVRDIMYVDTAGVILLQPGNTECPALFIHDILRERKEEAIIDDCLELDDPLITLMEREKRLITVYDLTRYSKHAEVAEACVRRFDVLRCTMILPLLFQGRLSGILALGRKKSGRFYSKEDVDLLSTLASQGAVAIENARLVAKMKEEEIIRANLSKYLSPQVVDQVIHKRLPIDLGGTRKDVTVLISDIRGFTKLTRTVPPERLTKILNEYFTEMASVIFKYQGSLDKYVGDAIIAVYGAVHENVMHLENPTANAYKTAIDMVNHMASLNRKWAEEHDGFHMDIGIGIDTGEVFLGNVGSPERMEFTVIGSAVNNAQHYSDKAGPDEILFSERTYAALGAKPRVQEVEDLSVQPGEQKILKVVNQRNQG